jgi:hypothetical protein
MTLAVPGISLVTMKNAKQPQKIPIYFSKDKISTMNPNKFYVGFRFICLSTFFITMKSMSNFFTNSKILNRKGIFSFGFEFKSANSEFSYRFYKLLEGAPLLRWQQRCGMYFCRSALQICRNENSSKTYSFWVIHSWFVRGSRRTPGTTYSYFPVHFETLM